MYTTQLLSALFIITSLLIVPGVHAAGGFAATCSGYFVRDNHFLQANCGDGVGGFKDSTLDLNLCIGNFGGNLVCARNGGYAGSCSGCGIRTGAFMTCRCGGTPQGSAIVADLNECVANLGGNLACAV
ncbi:hypothetical protein PLEOSDRAFT_1102691 [Pleurotus ostreatus PC15]|uniref:Cyanovirin-N domain-containing protein n=1 Tax=Pleurotus ostreatus (strain PC15) TaxID=1137138 RepID=A0A067NWY8_PLEO1|nr:hypothetical protein PLEOSDRAFT_1102691 [Pleurotus ostreatus PC15]